MNQSKEIINKVFSTTGSKITEKDIGLILYLSSKKSDKDIIEAIIEAVEHMKEKLKSVPDTFDYVSGSGNERILIDCKKVVNQLLKYIKSND